MAQLNITLNQDEILQLLSNDRDTEFAKLLQQSLNSILKAESAAQLKTWGRCFCLGELLQIERTERQKQHPRVSERTKRQKQRPRVSPASLKILNINIKGGVA